MSVRVDNGKYEFVVMDGIVHVRRGGKHWLTMQAGFNAVAAMMAELDAARVVLEVARLLGDEAPIALKHALKVHASLVDDREPPSDWCKS
jgi:hypothetical protein